MKKTSDNYILVYAKLKILEYMSCTVQDVIINEKYFRFYYPLDDAIQNKGYLTIVSHSYVDVISRINKIGTETLSMFDKNGGNRDTR